MLLDKLIGKQTEAGMGDTAFARMLGVSRVFWFKVRTGRRPIGLTILISTVRLYPDLIPEVIMFLMHSKSRAKR